VSIARAAVFGVVVWMVVNLMDDAKAGVVHARARGA
jgi:hypothetical protein